MEDETLGLDAWVESIEREIWAHLSNDIAEHIIEPHSHTCDLANGVACIHCPACGAFLGLDGPEARKAYWEQCNGSHTAATMEGTEA